MSKLKRLTMATLSASLLLTQGGPLPYLAYAVDSVNKDPINGEVKWLFGTIKLVEKYFYCKCLFYKFFS